MDHIHEALIELRCLNVIIEELPLDMLRIDVSRLWTLGYLLLFIDNKIQFSFISEFNYMYNANIYLNDVIPKSSLASYRQIKINTMKLSP